MNLRIAGGVKVGGGRGGGRDRLHAGSPPSGTVVRFQPHTLGSSLNYELRQQLQTHFLLIADCRWLIKLSFILFCV